MSAEDSEYIRKVVADAKEAAEDRDAVIRDAFVNGAGATELTRLTGLSRARIYQIKKQGKS